MSDPESWPRPHHTPGGGDARVAVAVYGRFARPQDDVLPALPDGVMAIHGRRGGSELFAKLRPLLRLAALRNPRPAAEAGRAPEVVLLDGSVPDPATLDYLRDTVACVDHLFEIGGAVAFDVPTLTCRTAREWRGRFSAPGAAVPGRHVEIVAVRDPGKWPLYKTMGLEKFGRPDLFVRRASTRHEAAIETLLGRYAEFLAFGGTLHPGEQVTGPGLPGTGRVRRTADPFDPDRAMIEFVWPDGALVRPWWRFW